MDRLARYHSRTYDLLVDEYEDRALNQSENAELRVGRLLSHAPSQSQVLDVGCGVGVTMAELTRRGFTPTGIDVSPRMASRATARSGAYVHVADIRDMDAEAEYDCLIADALVHLFPTRVAPRLIQHLLRFIRDDGILSISTTIDHTSAEGWLPKLDYPTQPIRYRRHWADGELAALVESFGLRVVDRYEFSDPYGKKTIVVTAIKAAG